MSVQYVKLGDVCAKDSSNIAKKDLKDCFGKYPVYGAGGYIQNVDFYHQEDEYIAIVKDGAGVGRAMILPAKSSVIGTMQYIIPDKNKVDMHYLYYAIINMALGKYFSGATIPHIYFKDYQKEIFKLPDLETQKKIADNLKNIDLIIAKKNKQIGLFNELVKSRFIEMFGEAQVNPRNFTIMPWEKVFFTTTGKLDSNAMVEDGQYPFFTCAKEIFKIDTYAFDCEALLLAGNNAAGIYDVKYYKGKFNAYQRTYVLRLTNSRWSYQLFKKQLEDKLLYLQTKSKGTNTRYLTMGILKELQFLVPSITLQNEFAHFVEQTDKSKLEIQKSLDKLEILKKSLMQQYFG